ncbi:MAG TPA: RibD family protein [Thermoanaerobaculia bacterium]|jgi:riboflavin-specific deaminase-like protein|nr:RibD family protein [Thermoanaerobaculia bacterium]
MRVDILTASSINGIITPGRGACSHDLVPILKPVRELWEAKYEIRRRHDAVLVGSNTVLSNDPTMSSHAAPGYEVVRATIDSAGRIPPRFRFFDGSVRTLVGVTDTTPASYRKLLEERGVEAVSCGAERPELSLFLAGLEERGVRSAVCEGGGILNRALLDQGFVGRIHLLLLEVILDAGSVNLFEGPGAPFPLRLETLERIGESVLLTYSV